LLNSELQIGKSVHPIQNVLFDRLRVAGSRRDGLSGSKLVSNAVRSKDLIRNRKLSCVPEFIYEPVDNGFVRGHCILAIDDFDV